MEAHVILFGFGVLALYEMQSLLVAHIHVQSCHSYKNYRNAQLEANS